MVNEIKSASDTFKRYNLGCGPIAFKGFLNVDLWPELSTNQIYQGLYGLENTFFLNFDLRDGVPARDDSLELIYHSHMLEHLTLQEGIAFVKESFRVLKKNGIMRIIVPDLELWINAYVANNTFFFEEYRKVLDQSIYATKGAVFMGMVHGWHHKFIYDFETLKFVLENAGFSNVRKTLFSSSSIADIKEIEPVNPLRAMESLCVECEKLV